MKAIRSCQSSDLPSARATIALTLLLLTIATAVRLGPIAQAAQNASGAAPARSSLRVLLLSGVGTHDWRATSKSIRETLASSGRFDLRIDEASAGISAASLQPFDLVVNDRNGPMERSDLNALESFVTSGHGLILTRSALASLLAADPTASELAKLSHVQRTKPTGQESQDGPDRLLEVRPSPSIATTHPLLRDIPTNNRIRVGDRPLAGLRPVDSSRTVLMSEHNEPLLWTATPGKGRIIALNLGHGLAAMQEPAYVGLLQRAAEWAATGEIVQPAALQTTPASTNTLRLLVITGGHDHETAFYGLFDDRKEFGWVPVTDSTLAFKQDLRSKYDVLVFYDFTRDLDEKARKNLRDFVEAGKGITVLHHGILNFQKWPWWYEEVVGGLYRLERQGTIPNSTVKFGEEHWITAAGPHPITDGLTPFHLTDETYHGLFISTNVQPLLLTDNPTSDRTVAWIGPCRTSRVVFIQLGHDHSPFRHPAYRALVSRSIRWTGGRLN